MNNKSRSGSPLIFVPDPLTSEFTMLGRVVFSAYCIDLCSETKGQCHCSVNVDRHMSAIGEIPIDLFANVSIVESADLVSAHITD